MQERLNNFLGSKYFTATVVILVAVISYSLGRISGVGERREPVRVTTSPPNSSLSNNPPNPPYVKGGTGEVKGVSSDSSGVVVASKNGTKYHYPWCAGAKQISEKNKITFNSTEEARTAGYTPAANCKGLK